MRNSIGTMRFRSLILVSAKTRWIDNDKLTVMPAMISKFLLTYALTSLRKASQIYLSDRVLRAARCVASSNSALRRF